MELPLRRSLRTQLNPVERYGLRLSLFAFSVLLIGVPFGLLVEQVLTDGPVTEMDNVAADRFHAWVAERRTLEYTVLAVTILGNIEWLYAFAAGVCVMLWMRHGRRLITYIAVTTMVGGVLNLTTKIVIARPRPLFEDPLASAFGKSFPSGHTTMSTIVYGCVLLAVLPLISPRWRPWAIAGTCLLVVLIGLSRLALGVHFVSDVAGGLVFGSAWLIASTAAFELWRVDRGRPKSLVLIEGVEPEEALGLNEPRWTDFRSVLRHEKRPKGA